MFSQELHTCGLADCTHNFRGTAIRPQDSGLDSYCSNKCQRWPGHKEGKFHGLSVCLFMPQDLWPQPPEGWNYWQAWATLLLYFILDPFPIHDCCFCLWLCLPHSGGNTEPKKPHNNIRERKMQGQRSNMSFIGKPPSHLTSSPHVPLPVRLVP